MKLWKFQKQNSVQPYVQTQRSLQEAFYFFGNNLKVLRKHLPEWVVWFTVKLPRSASQKTIPKDRAFF